MRYPAQRTMFNSKLREQNPCMGTSGPMVNTVGNNEMGDVTPPLDAWASVNVSISETRTGATGSLPSSTPGQFTRLSVVPQHGQLGLIERCQTCGCIRTFAFEDVTEEVYTPDASPVTAAGDSEEVDPEPADYQASEYEYALACVTVQESFLSNLDSPISKSSLLVILSHHFHADSLEARVSKAVNYCMKYQRRFISNFFMYSLFLSGEIVTKSYWKNNLSQIKSRLACVQNVDWARTSKTERAYHPYDSTKLQLCAKFRRNGRARLSQLASSHGEITEGDDPKGKGKNGKNQGMKKIARETLIAMLNSRGLPGAALYKGGSRAIGALKGGGKKKKGGQGRKNNNFATQQIVPKTMNTRAIVSNSRRLMSTNTSLSPPATRYLLSFIRGFDPMVRGVYICKTPARMSQKVFAMSRGNFVASSTTGRGYVCISPCLVNDSNCIWYTTAANTINSTSGIIMPDAAAPTNGVFGDQLVSLPYNRAAIIDTDAGDEVHGRVVSMTVSAYYIGKAVDVGGQFLVYASPTAERLGGITYTETTALAQAELTNVRMNRRVQVPVIPSKAIHWEYADSGSIVGGNTERLYPYSDGVSETDPSSIGSTTVGAPLSVIWVSGVNSAPYAYEVVIHNEYVGPRVSQSLLTNSTADPTGFEMVNILLDEASSYTAAYPEMSWEGAVNRAIRERGVKLSNLPDT
jgi:hypothetical protein